MTPLPIIGALARSHGDFADLLARLGSTPEDAAAVLRRHWRLRTEWLELA
jgi:hypothetical protein